MFPYKTIPMGDNAWQIQEKDVRSFLFAGRERALLIDSGLAITDMAGIVKRLTGLPVILVNTHADHDHIACNDQFAEVYMHPAEYAFYHENSGRIDGLRPLWDGDRLDLGGRTFQVVHTPGHTPGSVTMLDEQNRILVGGDGVQDWTIWMYGPQRDLYAYLQSLKRLEKLSGRFDLVYPSHGSSPVKASILPALIRGVERLLAGELRGEPWEGDPTPGVRRFDLGPAGILCTL